MLFPSTSEAKGVLRIRDLAYRPNQAYWMVELEMDCNKTKGYFEVEVVFCLTIIAM